MASTFGLNSRRAGRLISAANPDDRIYEPYGSALASRVSMT
jgi:hypothetical protein